MVYLGVTHINIHEWRRLREPDLHWEELILVVGLRLELERPAGILLGDVCLAPRAVQLAGRNSVASE